MVKKADSVLGLRGQKEGERMRMRTLIGASVMFIALITFVAWTVKPVGELPTQWSEADFSYKWRIDRATLR
jgi:hypothetical protein